MPIFTLHIGSLALSPTWYGLMYVLGFLAEYTFLRKFVTWHKKGDLDSLVVYTFLGVLFGGRLGYILLYDPMFFLSYPIEIIQVWKGGMSFHGGFLGVVTSVYFFAKKYRYHFWYLIDRIAVIIPIALAFGRIGNWINGELPGFAPYNGIFAMTIDGIGHFPNPLFEALLEGIILLIIMLISYAFTRAKDVPGKLSGIFLIGYAIARLIAEQFRLPDAQVGYLFETGYITLGMMYTIPMLLFGLYLFLKNPTVNPASPPETRAQQ